MEESYKEYSEYVDTKELLKHPANSAYFGDNEQMFKTWTLGPVIEHRDSDLLTQSNSAQIKAFLEGREDFNEQWEIVRYSCSLVGWRDHLSYKVLDIKGEVTEIAKEIDGIYTHMRNVYPVLDEEDWSEREYDSTLDSIREQASYCGLIDNAPDGFEYEIYRWLSENADSELEAHDGFGAYPSEESIVECLTELKMYCKDNDNTAN